MFAKFDEIPSLPVQDIKEKPKHCRQMERQTERRINRQRENSIPAPTNTVCRSIKKKKNKYPISNVLMHTKWSFKTKDNGVQIIKFK